MWLKHYRVHNTAFNTAVKMRPPTLDEAAGFFQIPKSTIAQWIQPETTQRILEQGGRQTRRDAPMVFLCKWLEMEEKLFDSFIARTDSGKPVGDQWFQRNSSEIWKETYLCPNLFVFSRGWFQGFLSRHRIVLRFITNTAQSLPSDYKEQILIWL